MVRQSFYFQTMPLKKTYTLEMDKKKQADILRNNGELDQAILTYQNLRDNELKNNRLTEAAEMLHMIGVCQNMAKNYDQALVSLNQTVLEFKLQGNKLLEGATWRDIGSVYREMADYQKSKESLDRSIKVLSETNNSDHLGMSKIYLAKTYIKEGNFKDAKDLINQGLIDIRKTKSPFFELTGLINLAKLELEKGNKKEAEKVGLQAKSLFKKEFDPGEYRLRFEEIEEILKQSTPSTN